MGHSPNIAKSKAPHTSLPYRPVPPPARGPDNGAELPLGPDVNEGGHAVTTIRDRYVLGLDRLAASGQIKRHVAEYCRWFVYKYWNSSLSGPMPQIPQATQARHRGVDVRTIRRTVALAKAAGVLVVYVHGVRRNADGSWWRRPNRTLAAWKRTLAMVRRGPGWAHAFAAVRERATRGRVIPLVPIRIHQSGPAPVPPGARATPTRASRPPPRGQPVPSCPLCDGLGAVGSHDQAGVERFARCSCW